MKKTRSVLIIFLLCLFLVTIIPLLSLSQVVDMSTGEAGDYRFSEDMMKDYAITMEGKEYLCLGQRGGYDERKPTAVLIYAGLPFSPQPMKVNGKLKNPLTIIVRGFKGGLIVPDKNSPTPLRSNLDPKTNQLKTKYFTHAINVTWQFPAKGIAFEADGIQYISERSNATIRFTEQGVKMDGINKPSKSWRILK